MNVKEEIKKYIASQPESKQLDMQALHERILRILPGGKLWFFDGTNDDGKIISNPTIGYGLHIIRYAKGTTREFFKIGLLANKTGISVHLMGISDKQYLAQTFGDTLGKASISGYCIRFRGLKDIDVEVLEAAIRYAIAQEPQG